MKKDRKFLIISVLIHVVLLIISVYIIIPKNDIFINSIKVYFFKANEIMIVSKFKNETPIQKQQEEAKSEKVSEKPDKSISTIQYPDSSIISKFTNNIENTARPNIINRDVETLQPNLSPKPNLPLYENISITRRINSNVKSQESELITASNHKIENIGNKSGMSIYAVSSVGPIGVGYGSKGQSSKYIDAMTTVMPRGGVDQFAYIFPSIAQGIGKRMTQGKLDVIFIIDTTGSMEDNVVGVKNYIEHFIKPLKDINIDLRLGLVEFSDIDARKEKIYDPTDNPDKFKKWLERTKFYGGRDLPESGYEAIVTAIEKIDYRKSAQRAFIFISDSPQHDFDYDGKSRYTLDRIIALLNEQKISVDVIGLDFLPIKQLAWGTGGQWKPIPGGNLRLDMPEPVPSKIGSKLTASMLILEDKVTVNFDGVVPDWIELSYKVLDPKGIKVIGALTYKKDIVDKSARKIEIPIQFDVNDFRDRPGIYTLIYRTRDSFGNENILRQNFALIVDS